MINPNSGFEKRNEFTRILAG